MFYYTMLIPLDETNLDGVKRLIQQTGFDHWVSKKSPLERCNYVHIQQTDLFYANVKNMIQGGRI